MFLGVARRASDQRVDRRLDRRAPVIGAIDRAGQVHETRAEIAKVTWPTRQEWLRLSGIVLAVTVVMAFILGAADAFGSWLVGLILT